MVEGSASFGFDFRLSPILWRSVLCLVTLIREIALGLVFRSACPSNTGSLARTCAALNSWITRSIAAGRGCRTRGRRGQARNVAGAFAIASVMDLSAFV
jgi:hypothetical protein